MSFQLGSSQGGWKWERMTYSLPMHPNEPKNWSYPMNHIHVCFSGTKLGRHKFKKRSTLYQALFIPSQIESLNQHCWFSQFGITHDEWRTCDRLHQCPLQNASSALLASFSITRVSIVFDYLTLPIISIGSAPVACQSTGLNPVTGFQFQGNWRRCQSLGL